MQFSLVGGNPNAHRQARIRCPASPTTSAATTTRNGRPTCAAFERVRYAGVYDGIDLVYYGNQQRLEYDFIVAPGRDPSAIRLRFDGARRVEIDGAGDLVVHVAGGEPVRQHKPVTYQEIDGERREVDSRYVMRGRR